MVDEKYARSQVMRLQGFDRFPSGAPARTEIAKALQKAHTRAIAEEAITSFTEGGRGNNRGCPLPGDIAELVSVLNQQRAKPADQKRGCIECEFTGWRPYWILTTEERKGDAVYKRKDRVDDPETADRLKKTKLGDNQAIYDFRERCSCSPSAV